MGSVGAVIVVGGRESRPQGEGRQGLDIPGTEVASRRATDKPDEVLGKGPKAKGVDDLEGNLGEAMPSPGEPCALKGASTVRREGSGNGSKDTAPGSDPTKLSRSDGSAER